MTGSEPYDAVVIGSGPGGRGCASRLNDAGMRVAMLESELVGGECPFWACIPSKTLIRPGEVVSEAHRAAGLSDPAMTWREISDYRDYMNSGLDDSAKFAQYSESGIDVIRGHGRIVASGVVEVADRRLETERIIIATGSAAAVPHLDGLDRVKFWTNREGTSFREIPASTIVLGGGPVGIELGQMLSRYGSKVTIVESAQRLLAREHPRVGDLIAQLLAEEGIVIRTGAEAERVEADGDITRVQLANGDVVEGERLLVAIGRKPRVEELGLKAAGVEHDERGIKIDKHCRAAPGVWAIGDVTGIAQFTHVAAYQARIAAADIQGREAEADYSAVPRVVFTDPEVAAVGLSPEQAKDAGIDLVEASVDIGEVDRTATYGRDLKGQLGLVADARSETLVGAWAIGPLASEWIHTAVIAVKAQVPIAVLRDTAIQFPTFSEGLLLAADRLAVGGGNR